jgi:hypothetical protein
MEVVTRNLFVPLRAGDRNTDSSGTEAASNEEAVPGKTGRPTTNLIQFTKQLQSVVKEFASGQSVERSGNARTADYDRV